MAQTAGGVAAVKAADDTAAQKLEQQPDELFLEYSQNGNRSRWQSVAFRRRARIDTLTIGECLQDKGRFIAPLEETVRAICAERTWLMPAHDGSLANFKGQARDIDLASSALAWRLATSAWLLGDKLSPEVRALIAENVDRRVVTPYRDMIEGRLKPNWWIKGTNNWNAVCAAGCIGAALATVPAAADRARFVAAVQEDILYFLKGFTPDGYCDEGLGYWNYGFGNFVMLSETLNQATGGRVDLLGLPGAQAPARFAREIQIIKGVSPAFADCGVGAKPDPILSDYLARRFGWPTGDLAVLVASALRGDLQTACLYGLPNSVSGLASGVQPEPAPLRSYFKDAGVLIGRPAAGSDGQFGVALKGGHNAENHNHNDVGSYVAVVGAVPVLLDPGNEAYTARTFSAKRYESNLLNSFGHPVPRVAGQLQRTGREAKATVISAEFGDQVDRWVLDLTTCYSVPELVSLQRAFVYDRGGSGSLTITDQAKFSSPQAFETALLTAGSFRAIDPLHFQAGYRGEAVDITVDPGGADVSTATERIHEESPIQPERLALALAQPATGATISVTVRPVATDAGAPGSYLRGGDFAQADWYWEMGRSGHATVEALPEGGHVLRLRDPGANTSADATSSTSPVPAATALVLTGRARVLSGAGIGLYLRFLDEAGQQINGPDAAGNEAPLMVLQGGDGTWKPFSAPFTTPPGTKRMTMWIHTMMGATVDAQLADLAIRTAQP